MKFATEHRPTNSAHSDQEALMQHNETTPDSSPAKTAKKPSRFARGLAALGLVAALTSGSLAAATPAEAAAFSYDVYAPNKVSRWTMDAWANLSRNCSGTYGCYNYMKIEKLQWWGWSHYAGHWAGAHGWNSIRANINGGCAKYRLTVDSYNDVAGSYGSGTNMGSVGSTSNGTKIYRYKTSWSGGTRQICRG